MRIPLIRTDPLQIIRQIPIRHTRRTSPHTRKTHRSSGIPLLRLLIRVRSLVALVVLLGLARFTLLAATPDAEEIIQHDSRENIEENVRPHDAEVAPSVAPLNSRAGEEGVSDADGAVSALFCSVRVEEVAGCLLEVRLEVGLTRKASGRVDHTQFLLGAGDLAAVKHCRGHPGDPISHGRDAVHEDPEAWEAGGALHDAVEDEGHGEEEGDDRAGGLRIGHGGDAHVCEGGGVDQEDDAEEEDEALSFGALDADDGVVEGRVYEEAGDDLVGNFDDDVGQEESFPAVSF